MDEELLQDMNEPHEGTFGLVQKLLMHSTIVSIERVPVFAV